ncbi:hypothetical protein LWC35_17935 [Pseudonocardia kujensis]|uniref:hypothetical protein n=1 Tax=Pseudonocardia kujensis TaxID=1128675 RepID=UPI001E474C53|nr:hypothetical protein [Pseudonocardia kujensis]MCE0764774.1 hypothetical protein [Pseudonocardia kujensis]
MSELPKHSVAVVGVVVDDQTRALDVQHRDHGHWEPPAVYWSLGRSSTTASVGCQAGDWGECEGGDQAAWLSQDAREGGGRSSLELFDEWMHDEQLPAIDSIGLLAPAAGLACRRGVGR